MKAVRLLVLLTLTTLVLGCGQKGPLVMPDAQHPRKKAKFPAPPKTSPAPASAPATAPPATATPPDSAAPATSPAAPSAPVPAPAPQP